MFVGLWNCGPDINATRGAALKSEVGRAGKTSGGMPLERLVNEFKNTLRRAEGIVQFRIDKRSIGGAQARVKLTAHPVKFTRVGTLE